MNQELIFKYKPESLSELTTMNHFLTQKVSMLHKEAKDFPVTLRYLHQYEEEISLKAIQSKKTNLKESDVDYYINPFGYREEKPIEETYNSIGVWGCSYTFGVGVPAKDLYTNILVDKIKSPVYNFGIPGAGIQKVAKSFVINNNFFKFKTAFFVLPSLYRFEYVTSNCYDTPEEVSSDTVNSFDLIPNWFPSHNKELARKGKMLYELYDDVSFLAELVKNLELIKQNAEINGTKVYFTTWCINTYDLLTKYSICKPKVVQFLESNKENMGNYVSDFARDGIHPGVRSHAATAEILYDVYSTSLRSISSLKFI